MDRGKSKGFANSTGESIADGAATVTTGGNTNAVAVTIERSESWQQDMEQAVMPGMSWPQSM